MIEARGGAVSHDDFAVTWELRLFDRDGSGIRSFKIVDRDEAEIPGAEQPQDCPTVHVFRITVPRYRTPFRIVELRNCAGQIFPPVEVGGDDPDLGPPMPCSAVLCETPSPECAEAVATLQSFRNRVLERCAELNARQDERNRWAMRTAAAYAAAWALGNVATRLAGLPFNIGRALAAVFAAAAALALVVAIAFSVRLVVLDRRVSQAQDALAEARREFSEAADSVGESRVCCPHCLGSYGVSLDIPGCP